MGLNQKMLSILTSRMRFSSICRKFLLPFEVRHIEALASERVWFYQAFAHSLGLHLADAVLQEILGRHERRLLPLEVAGRGGQLTIKHGRLKAIQLRLGVPEPTLERTWVCSNPCQTKQTR